ncbi:MAG: AmmeMemoRadiSam system radical SAM enzyme [Peptococcaceae bacterium]|nr:AmmeMemoRadiSam system radical SAM enzyme [Candidatus Syntrophopropionicum ammoniitolerans]
MREALYYEKKDKNVAACLLCPHYCKIQDGKAGICRARQNKGGTLYATNFGRVTSYGIDPIEKKPLYHFYPGSYILSAGTFGCNLQCQFCQNWQIAQGEPDTTNITPADLVEISSNYSNMGYPNIGLAYTYNEPFMWYEFVYETAKLAREADLKNVLVTNGSVNGAPLRQILPYIDAMNIDVKGFTEDYYKKYCKGSLQPVLHTVETALQECHVELTTLLIPGLNDSVEEIEHLISWVASLDPGIPLHFSRYFPMYKMDLPATPVEKLVQAREIALKKLHYVYIGNVQVPGASDTFCPKCGDEVINRVGYTTQGVGLSGRSCGHCGEEIKYVGEIFK